MNETRGNSRTKPMRGGLKGGEINSLKDSEKTNDKELPITLDIKLTFYNAIDSKNYHFIEHIKKENQDSFYKSLIIILNRWCK